MRKIETLFLNHNHLKTQWFQEGFGKIIPENEHSSEIIPWVVTFVHLRSIKWWVPYFNFFVSLYVFLAIYKVVFNALV